MTSDLFDRAVALAKQRAQLLALANDPDARGQTTRRQLLIRARKVERIIVGIADLAISVNRSRGPR